MKPTNKRPRDPSAYCVLDITTGQVKYLGGSELGAANVLEPGTCYGAGECKTSAIADAMVWAEWFRKQDEARVA
jgi:hypothetical protein